MERVSAHEQGAYERGDTGRFTGDVWLSPGRSIGDVAGMSVVHFSAGSRTHWHRHTGGQLLYGVSGRGRVRSRGESASAILPGDIIAIPPGEWHYHGGAPDSPMAHVSVNVGGPPEWADAVTEEEYAEGF